MKTVKFALIAAFISAAMLSYSSNYSESAKPEKRIAIEKAIGDRVILAAMNYINEDLISVERQGFYYAKIRVRNSMIVVYGDYAAWQEYFIQRKWVNNNYMPIKIDRYTY